MQHVNHQVPFLSRECVLQEPAPDLAPNPLRQRSHNAGAWPGWRARCMSSEYAFCAPAASEQGALRNAVGLSRHRVPPCNPPSHGYA